MSESTDRRCGRCDGCGKITGTGRDECPWTRFGDLPTHVALEKVLGMRAPRVCPDCGGTGRLARSERPVEPPE